MIALVLAVLAAALDPSLLPRFPGAESVAIGTTVQLGQATARLAYFVTPAQVEEVGEYFLRRWQSEGWPTVVDGTPHRELVISAFLTRTGQQWAVVASRQGAVTLGFAVVVDLWDAEAPGPTQAPAGVGGSEAASFRPGEVLFTAAAVAEVRQAIDRAAGEAGLSAGPSQEEGATQLLEHRGPGTRVLTVLLSLGPRSTAVWQLEQPVTR
ncbi:MAG: hypothetical protein M3Y59_16525 [Myxococcota bacterium]|nr:hypothetical protein [Myxococcota bacterium]